MILPLLGFLLHFEPSLLFLVPFAAVAKLVDAHA